MNTDDISASIDGKEVAVTVRGFNILYKLLSYPKHTFSRAQLMDKFWEIDSETSLRAVDVYIMKLKDKFLQCNGLKLITVHGFGYKAVLIE